MTAFPHRTLTGDAAFGNHLLRTALDAGFEPSVSHRLALDHGFCIPLWKSGLDPLPAIVPLILNALEPPMPTVARCAAWGELLAQAIASYPLDVRIGVLASGGLSHSIGEATMGDIDETFDRGCIAALASPDPHALIDYLDVELPRAGNGSHELRNWVVAQAAAGGRPFTLLDYYALPEVYVGCAWAKWSTIA
jgi:aromatic ring-opening dioxygenase catalytic subunit (LigB family)